MTGEDSTFSLNGISLFKDLTLKRFHTKFRSDRLSLGVFDLAMVLASH